MLSSQEARRRGRLGALATHSRHDARELTAPARSKFLQRFVDQVDPQRTLDESERLRRAEYAKKHYFAKLALQSVHARRGGAP